MNASTHPSHRPDVRIGSWRSAEGPGVVGTATAVDTLRACVESRSAECDIVEVRLDQMISEGASWIRPCRELHQREVPLLLTLRHESEGGEWAGTNAQRLKVLKRTVGWVAAVDVEIEQGAVAPAVEGLPGVTVIGSFHDFHAAPDDSRLDGIIAKGIEAGADIVKIACWIEDEETLARLRTRVAKPHAIPLAIVGMGPLGPQSRLDLPRAGSCLTYGFLDAAVAPGQVPAGELKRGIREI